MSNYWTSRLADKIYESGSEETIKKLRKEYKKASKEIKAAIEDLYFKLLEEGQLTTTELYKYGRYDQCMKEINKIIKELGGREQDLIKLELQNAYKEAFNQTTAGLNGSVSWGIQNQLIMEEVINANFKGANFSDRIWTNKTKLTKLIEKEIMNNVASGQSKDIAIKAIINKTGVAFSDADRLVRTETMRVINYGQINSYKQNGYTQLQILIGHDERTCEDCLKKDKETIDINSSDIPPFHPRCRCTAIPVLKTKINYGSEERLDSIFE